MKKKKFILPSAKAVNIKPRQLFYGSPVDVVDVDPYAEGNQYEAE